LILITFVCEKFLFIFQPRVTDGRVMKSSPLWDSVKGLKSWGCSFFAPVVEGQRTMYYDETDSKVGRFTFVRATEEEGLLMDDDEEDVFDPKMDFGMSILVDGKALVQRAILVRSEENLVDCIIPEVANASSVPAGEVLMQDLPNSSSLTTNIMIPAPSNTSVNLQDSVVDSDIDKMSVDKTTGSSVVTKDPEQIPPASPVKASPVKSSKSKSSTVGTTGQVPSKQVLDTSKISPASSEKGSSTKSSPIVSDRSRESDLGARVTKSLDKAKKSDVLPKQSQSSRAVVNHEKVLPGSSVKQPLKPTLSSSLNELNEASAPTSDETYIFLSAESQLHLSSNTSSSDNFYSAESDVENFNPSPLKPVASVPVLDGCAVVSEKSPEKEEIHPRPANLEFNHPRNVVRKLELSTEREYVSRSAISLNISDKKSLNDPESFTEITSCYGCLLASAKFKDSDWLSDFDVIEDGVHPSVVIEKPDQKSNRKRVTDDIFRRNPGENCTNVILHIKVIKQFFKLANSSAVY